MQPDQRPLAANAVWMWDSRVQGVNSYVEFQQEIILDRPFQEAWIQLSAETSLRLWVNGRLVHTGPPREVPPYFYFDTIDLLPHLKNGSNVIRIVSHHQGADSQSYQAGTPATLVAGECRIDGAAVVDFAECARWEVRPITQYRRDAHRLFSCLGFSEHVDFDAAEADWNPVILVAPHPWTERPEALPRDLPLFQEIKYQPKKIMAHRGGWLIDFGREVSGYVELDLDSFQSISLRLSYAEELIDDLVRTEKGGMAYYDMLEVPDRPVRWRSYEKRAFRYLQLSQPLNSFEIKIAEQNYPYIAQYANTATYRENENSPQGRLINRVLKTSARTIELNSEDILTDCPWRERAQYFDCYFYMEAMQQLFGTLEPVRRFMNQFSRGADDTGLLRMCYPSPVGSAIIPDFSISYAISLQLYLQLSGDMETVRRNLSLAIRGVTAFRQYEDDQSLLTNLPGWIFIDNTFELSKFPRSAALNAVYHGGYLAIAGLLQACGRHLEAEEFAGHARLIRSGFRRVFVRPDRVLDSDSTLEHEDFRYWTYHFSAETNRWEGKTFRLRTRYKLDAPNQSLCFAVNAGGRAWIDGKPAAQTKEGGSWSRSALFQPIELETPHDLEWHRIDLEVEWNNIDWEFYISSPGKVEWDAAQVWEDSEFGAGHSDDPIPAAAFTSTLRNYNLPWMSQATVGHAAFHGLLEPGEARQFLSACLPGDYPFSFAKRTTPFFAKIEDTINPRRILPCNVPASMFYFCHALKRYGMEAEAKALLLTIYEGMLQRGATTWWEEWNTRSSHCHAWASFVATFVASTENPCK